jgi:hypothetical protein
MPESIQVSDRIKKSHEVRTSSGLRSEIWGARSFGVDQMWDTRLIRYELPAALENFRNTCRLFEGLERWLFLEEKTT